MERKPRTGFLPQYRNLLAGTVEPQEQADLLVDVERLQKALQRLLDQAPAMTSSQIINESAALLQQGGHVDCVWFAAVSTTQKTLSILGGSQKARGVLNKTFSLYEISPVHAILAGKGCAFPRNVLIAFPNDPYLLKYNINGILAQPIRDANNLVIGMIAAVDSVAIYHPEKICPLLSMAAEGLGKFIFSSAE